MTSILFFALMNPVQAQDDLPGVAEECKEVARQGPPADYDEQAQADFILNYVAMGTTFSPLHGALGDEPGHGAIGVDLLGLPPLGCEQRLTLSYTKSEDTNKTPVAPRIRASFTFPEIAGLRVYSGWAYIPPVTLAGVRNVLLSGELGVGKALDSGLGLGARYHATMFKTIGEVATPFNPDDEAVDDLYLSSTFGLDLMASYALEKLEPYLALGWADASTFFLIGDDDYIGNNHNPYWGPTISFGSEFDLIDSVFTAAEVYWAPGAILTGRARIAYTF